MDGDKSALNHTGLTDDEAQEVHAFFMKGAMAWGAVALVAHILVYSWQPWFSGGA